MPSSAGLQETLDLIRFGGHFPYASAIIEVIMERRKRRELTDQYKAEIVELVRTSEKTVTQLAKDLDLTPSSITNWVRQSKASIGANQESFISADEKAELLRLRRDNRELKMERDFLKKTAGFFARECK